MACLSFTQWIAASVYRKMNVRSVDTRVGCKGKELTPIKDILTQSACDLLQCINTAINRAHCPFDLGLSAKGFQHTKRDIDTRKPSTDVQQPHTAQNEISRYPPHYDSRSNSRLCDTNPPKSGYPRSLRLPTHLIPGYLLRTVCRLVPPRRSRRLLEKEIRALSTPI